MGSGGGRGWRGVAEVGGGSAAAAAAVAGALIRRRLAAAAAAAAAAVAAAAALGIVRVICVVVVTFEGGLAGDQRSEDCGRGLVVPSLLCDLDSDGEGNVWL